MRIRKAGLPALFLCLVVGFGACGDSDGAGDADSADIGDTGNGDTDDAPDTPDDGSDATPDGASDATDTVGDADSDSGDDAFGCDEYILCRGLCPPPGGECEDFCDAAASAATVAANADMVACLAGKACLFLQDEDEFIECLALECGSLAADCDEIVVPLGDDSCADIDECVSGCGNEDGGCAVQCRFGADADELPLYSEWIACRDSHCSDAANDEQRAECLAESCAPELEACFPPAILTCAEHWACRVACQNTDCESACDESTASAALAEYADLASCIADSGCGGLNGSAFENCIDTNCASEREVCTLPSDDTITSCSDLLACGAACSPNDADCNQGCFESASASARADADALFVCVQANECSDSTCVETKCPSEAAVCGL